MRDNFSATMGLLSVFKPQLLAIFIKFRNVLTLAQFIKRLESLLNLYNFLHVCCSSGKFSEMWKLYELLEISMNFWRAH